MCGIVGVFNHPEAKKQVEKALVILEDRGQDGSGVIETPNGACGHILHAIVGHVQQPLQGKGVLVANCEIYNWQELGEGRNDAEVLLNLLDKNDLTEESLKELLDRLDGDYAFIYQRDDKVVFARDLIGVKPLWYSPQHGLSVASTKAALIASDCSILIDLNPRKIGIYDIPTQHLEFFQREFYTSKHKYQDKSEDEWSTEVKELFLQALHKRIPSQDITVGVLLSGGLDSTLIAKCLQDAGVKVKCYTAYVKNPKGKVAHDLTAAQSVAQTYGFDLTTIGVTEDKIPTLAHTITQLIEEAHAVKATVAMPFYVCAQAAVQDGCKILFSGLGAEELYAGYKRHKDSDDVNNECINGLMWMYERDLYRDDVITMNQGIELRVPFLDKELITHAITIPSKFKIHDGIEKYILRLAAQELGLSKQDAFRPKKAAQYGSKFDNALEKIARREGKNRVDYLAQFTTGKNRKLGVLCSGGKDSWYAAYIMHKQHYELSCLLAMKSENEDSYMFHTPAIDLVAEQALASGIPLLEQETQGEKEEELLDLRRLLQRAQEQYHIDGVVVGALYSQYQRERVENICNDLGLKCYTPLWHIGQASELQELLSEEFEVVMSSIAGEGLSKEWLGRVLDDEAYSELLELERKIGFNVAGEGGEYESLVLDCPLFTQKLVVEGKAKMENEITGRWTIQKVTLREKK